MIQGINENIPYRGVEFHIQTEDKGMERGLIVSTLFHSGMIILEKRVSYKDLPPERQTEDGLSLLLKETHEGMRRELLSGELDERIRLFIPIEKGKKGEAALSDAEEEMIKKVREEVLPSIVRDLGVELTRDDLKGIRKAISVSSGLPPKDRYLSLYKEIFRLIQDRCDRDTYKGMVKVWTGLEKRKPEPRPVPPPRPTPSAVTHPSEPSSKELEITPEEMKQLVMRLTIPELTRVIGESLSEALYHKVFSEIHDSFYLKENAFILLADRILSSGIIRKRVSDEWRADVKTTWLKRYERVKGLKS